MPLQNSHFPFQRIVNQMRAVAEHVEHTPSALCPCSDGNANRANPNHVLCRGSGHIPLTAQTHLIRALVSHFSSRYSQMDAGAALPGDLVIAPMARDQVVMGPWDILRLTGWELGESYPGDIVQVPSFGTPRQNMLVYTPKRIEQCFSVSLPSDPSSAVIPYTEGVDFSVSGHVLTWIHPPADGTFVSVKYRAIMEYVIVDVPDARYERGTTLGERVLARKREFLQLGVAGGNKGSFF